MSRIGFNHRVISGFSTFVGWALIAPKMQLRWLKAYKYFCHLSISLIIVFSPNPFNAFHTFSQRCKLLQISLFDDLFYYLSFDASIFQICSQFEFILSVECGQQRNRFGNPAFNFFNPLYQCLFFPRILRFQFINSVF